MRRIVQQLCQILLSLTSPSSQIGAKPVMGMPAIEKGPSFVEGGPTLRQGMNLAYRRKPLELLDFNIRRITTQCESEPAMRFARHLPISSKLHRTEEGIRDQQMVKLRPMQCCGLLSVKDLAVEFAQDHRGRHGIRGILPITSNDEGRMGVVQQPRCASRPG